MMQNSDAQALDAVVIGATGLVGGALVQQLIVHDSFKSVLIFARNKTGLTHPKLTEVIIDFEKPEEWQARVKGDVLFSTLGTTILQAGSQDAQYRVDFTYQYLFAEAAAKNKVGRYVLVSSVGASPSSRFFYTRMKGELEMAVRVLPFRQVEIIQPGFLDGAGTRKDKRPLEKIGVAVTKGFNMLGLFRKYGPVKGETVAKAMINATLKDNPGVHVWPLAEIFTLSGE
jgi:uncharacterized protein YbjT (DUF2867 family)